MDLNTTVKSNPLVISFILTSLAVIVYAVQFPSGEDLGPGFFPILVSVGIIVFAVGELFAESSGAELDLSEYDLTPPAIMLGLFVAYVLLMPIMGFWVGTMVFLPIVFYYSGVRSLAGIGLLSVGLPTLLFYIFNEIFLVRLPEGVIPVSRLLPELPLWVI
ncbi:tripartite tricarboxylate transporter TctB family protein [Natronococcus roseus]|uniref:tripartite tricarboxylate transporter TctB family protein n=1 Tax=Natronococcus roseus TaxID=1052014 RepID=UPI00374DABFA